MKGSGLVALYLISTHSLDAPPPPNQEPGAVETFVPLVDVNISKVRLLSPWASMRAHAVYVVPRVVNMELGRHVLAKIVRSVVFPSFL